MDTSKIVGEKIKSLREAKGIRIEELAERSGLALEQIQRIETNIDLPSLAPLIKIARVLGVRFWDYAALPLNYKGQVCAPFSLCWSVLGLVLVYGLHPWTAAVVETIPGWLFPPALILTAVDAGVSAWALRRTGDIQVLRWYCPAPAEKN